MNNKGLIGLENIGNTCYLNSSIQCLSNIQSLTEYILNDEYTEDLKNKKKNNNIILTREYSKLIKAIWTNNTTIQPKSFHSYIQKFDDQFQGFEHQDAQELLAMILDYLHEALKYEVSMEFEGIVENEEDEITVESLKNWNLELKDKYSIIVKLFFGQFINKVVSMEEDNKNKMISKTFEVFNMLNIPIHGKTLYDSLQIYFGKEILESKFYDEKNKTYINAYRQIKLMKIPNFLILVLKRFTNGNGRLAKSNALITFPIEKLDLSAYCEGYDKFDGTMRLISIGCHTGSLNFGHYFAICRHINKKWYKYDDDRVEEFDINSNKNSIFRDGYILIYEKLNVE